MTTQTFKTTVAKSGGKTYIAIPFDPNEVWGDKQRHHIRGTINGCMVRGPLGSDDGSYFLALGDAWRRDNGVEAGTEVEVVLAPEGPQSTTMSPDIVAALDAEPQAQEFFNALATFYRKGYTNWIEGAKRPETRAARIAEMIQLLKEGKKQK
jgi:hypothetical protein